jgi:hypothetical protein
MKSEQEISVRVRELLVAELADRIKDATNKLPPNCKYNHRHPLDERRTVDGDPNPTYNQITARKTIGLCMYGSEDPTEWPGDICEDAVDAMRCPYFDPVKSEDAVVEEFQLLIKDPEWLAVNLPGIAELRWVLDGQQAVHATLGGEATMAAAPEVVAADRETVVVESKMLVPAVGSTGVERVTALVDTHVENTPTPDLAVTAPVVKVTLSAVIEAWFSRVWRAVWGK